MYKLACILFILPFLTGNTGSEKTSRMYMNTTFRPGQAKSIRKVLINFQDSIPDDTLSLYFSDANIPIVFSRDIHTAVCLDTVCRLVNITLYWEITGKYLGYSLPDGEELTKKEHFPFILSDYNRLHEILADSSSQLGFYTPEEMHPVKTAVTKTDGITGATPPDISAWIVPAAAYTSYSLWHLTYGATRDSIIAFTKKNLLNNNLLTSQLESNDPYSQLMALRWITETNQECKQYTEPAVKILNNGNFTTSVHALKFLRKCEPDKTKLQQKVVYLLDSEDFRIKNMAIGYLRESDSIAQPVAKELLTRLKSDNYYLVNVILGLFEKRYQPDFQDQKFLCEMLNSKNVNIANRIYYFLLNITDPSPELVKQLKRYKKKEL